MSNLQGLNPRQSSELGAVVRDFRGRSKSMTRRGSVLPTTYAPVGVFIVLVKWVGGADGTSTAAATWTYDLYDIADTTFTNKLNATGGARQPRRSAARILKAKVTKATDGTEGIAYTDAAGDVQLWDCIETVNQTNC